MSFKCLNPEQRDQNRPSSCTDGNQREYYSYSSTVGRGYGSVFSAVGAGRITAIRVWERYNSYIHGFQLRFGYSWTPVYGRSSGNLQQMELFDDEAIVQLSGKYAYDYIRYLSFTTSRGRTFIAGQPYGTSFNFYPAHDGSELRILSGRSDYRGITAIGAHWGTVVMDTDAAATESVSTAVTVH
ncbi:zymogen granule membrane protein 16-like [Chanos chanos]|uniref:Zymogen granule membrane protein 16-like n=1 Tax=Chanos chanos TaxID=29144 RepID=A0A6J2W4N1_CHACN|nr:zymogen granule membrane protein 16-like [Chanos chanos]